MKYFLQILIYSLLLIPLNSNAQDCQKFLERKCQIEDAPGFTSSLSRSKSAVLELNKKFMTQTIFYGQRDYKVLVCAEDSKGVKTIMTRLIQPESQKVIYDSRNNGDSPLIEFTVESTMRLIVEVTLIGDDSYKPSKGDDTRICTAISVAYKKTPKVGF